MKNIEKILENIIVRRLIYLICFFIIWQLIYNTQLFSKILFPSPALVIEKLFAEITDGSMLIKTGYTLYLIFLGLLVSFLITAVLIVFSNISPVFKDLMRTLISVFDPLPGIALLPIAILWFGIGKTAIIFIMVHSVIWPTLLSVITGFDSIPKIYKEVGQNIGLTKLQMIRDIYVPAAFPSILMGIKNGWARAWRSLIAAEMVFGTTGAIGGLGWDIYLKRNYLDMPGMLATLLILMIIGILIEDLFFKTLENKTIRKWGMVS